MWYIYMIAKWRGVMETVIYIWMGVFLGRKWDGKRFWGSLSVVIWLMVMSLLKAKFGTIFNNFGSFGTKKTGNRLKFIFFQFLRL